MARDGSNGRTLRPEASGGRGRGRARPAAGSTPGRPAHGPVLPHPRAARIVPPRAGGPILTTLLAWLAAEPLRYWSLAWSFAGAACALAWAEEFPGRSRASRLLRHPAAFAVSVAGTVLAFRWPTFFAPAQPNPDESQLIAGALTLRRHVLFWAEVDGGTAGPLDFYVLLAAPLLGLSLDFVGARALGALLQAAALLGVWLAVRRAVDPTSARLGVLPALVAWSATTFWDLFQYSTEMLPLALLAAAAALGTGSAAWPAPRRMLGLAGTGALLGCIAFAKVHAVLLGALTGVLVAAPLLRARQWRALAALVGGTLVPAALVGLYVSAFGLWPVFWKAYVLSNVVYVSEPDFTWKEVLGIGLEFMRAVPGYAPFFTATMIASAFALGAAVLAPWRGWRDAAPGLLGLAVMATALVTVVLPGRLFGHYLHFLVPSSAVLLATALGALRARLTRFPRVAAVLAAVTVGGALAPQVQWRRSEPNPFLAAFAENRASWRTAPARRILAEARDGDRLTVWGWHPSLHVETGLAQGTKDVHTQRLVEAGPLRTFYRMRYLADFERTRPRWFVDAVGGTNFAYQDRTRHGHEMFVRLARMVASDYDLVADIDGSRIYRRRP